MQNVFQASLKLKLGVPWPQTQTIVNNFGFDLSTNKYTK